MKTLRVLISESWPENSDARWALLGDDDSLQSEGTSDPRNWPESDRIEALLIGAQCSWHSVRVPRASVREQARSVGFALEEQLVREPDSQHVTPTDQGDESWSVLVIARERLRRLTAQFEAIKRPLDAIYSAAQAIPLTEGTWTFALHGSEAYLRTGQHSGLPDDLLDPMPPPMLAAVIEQARNSGTLPHTLQLVSTANVDIDLNAWGTLLHIPVQPGGTMGGLWEWYHVPGDAANLLHGEFASRHRSDAWMKLVKPAAVMAVLVLLLDLGLGIGEVFIRRAELASLRSEMTRLLRSQLPTAPAQDPPMQLRRELNQQRSARGQLADDEMLSLLAELSASLGGDTTDTLQSLRYEGGSLDVVLAPGKTEPTGLMQRLAARGVRAVQRDGNPTQFVLRREG